MTTRDAMYIGNQLQSRKPADHLRDGHNVTAFWSTDTAGHLRLDATGSLDIYDTESLDPGPTETIVCSTCGDMELIVEEI